VAITERRSVTMINGALNLLFKKGTRLPVAGLREIVAEPLSPLVEVGRWRERLDRATVAAEPDSPLSRGVLTAFA
jgi:hypothetical protein